MPNSRIAVPSALAACALLLTAAAAAFPTHAGEPFSLDLTPLHRVTSEPSFQAGTYAAEDPHATHRHSHATAHHRAL